MKRDISFPTGHGRLAGLLEAPTSARGLVLAASLHASSNANTIAAAHARQYACLVLHLLTGQEIAFADNAHNVPLLADRLLQVLELVATDPDTAELPLAIFAEAAVTPAAVRVAARRDRQIRCLACHGGLIDGAGLQYLEVLSSPVLMLADIEDEVSASSFRRAATHLAGPWELRRVPSGGIPAAMAMDWFAPYLVA
ncbi:MAG: hypothetical protein U1E96_10440 [Azonexus sp.]